MLEVRNITCSYQENKVLNALDLQVKTGEICAIIGPSGCGKSTLLKGIAGLLPLDEGAILFNGENLSANERTIAFIPQNYGLLLWKTVEQNILLALDLKEKGKSKAEKIQLVDKMLEKLGLGKEKKKYPSRLSGGQKQRVAIARAFILSADLLLMDEPFSALDSLTKESVIDFFLKLWQEEQITTVLITHDIQEAVALAEKIVLMNKHGEIVTIFEQEKLERDSEKYIQRCLEIRQMMKKEEVGSD